jgi:hypothetical protein
MSFTFGLSQKSFKIVRSQWTWMMTGKMIEVRKVLMERKNHIRCNMICRHKKNSGGAAKVVAPSSTIKPSVNNSQHGRKLIHHIQAIEMMRESSLLDWPTIEDAESDSDEDELQDMHNSYNISEEAALISELGTQVIPAAEMAAILETATPGRRSKRRAEIVDESSLEHTKKIKAARNLDFNPAKGNIKNRRTLLYKYNFSMSKLLVISMQ